MRNGSRGPVGDGSAGRGRFHHEAFLYAEDAGFLAGTFPVVARALAAAEPVLVAVPVPRIDLLRHALGDDARRVRFVDITGIGGNPARIIPLWREFLARHDGRRVVGVGEPVWPGRDPGELRECYVHESLLNLAFDGGPGWFLMCPYDVRGLDPAVVDQALSAHPMVLRGQDRRRYAGYRAPDGHLLSEPPLPEPPRWAPELVMAGGLSSEGWRLVRAQAREVGLPAGKTDDLLVAVEAVVREGLEPGRPCRFRVWWHGRLTCEVRGGPLADPLAGRRTPLAGESGSRGLWLANQLCDLVELQSSPSETIVRLHMNGR
jgi:hypothetical protein